MENKKQSIWENYLDKSGLRAGFEIITKDNSTLSTIKYDTEHLSQISLTLIIDYSLTSIIRFNLATIPTAKITKDLKNFIAQENANTELIKLYLKDNELLLDVFYLATNEAFNPNLIVIIVKQVLTYIKSIEGHLSTLIISED